MTTLSPHARVGTAALGCPVQRSSTAFLTVGKLRPLPGTQPSHPNSPTRYNVRLHPALFPESWAAWKEIMPTDIIMPQMGESIVEGTITKWLKKPGDKVQRDEPLFEISTDKVDAEIPAPASGVLQEIKVTEGTTVSVNTVVGTIAADGEAAAPAKAAPAAPAPPEKEERPAPEKKPEIKEEKKPAAAPSPAPAASAPPPQQPAADEEARSSPLVRRSLASMASAFRKFPAPDSAAASPSRTSWPSSIASPRRPPLRPRLLNRQLHLPPPAPPFIPATSSPCRTCAKSSPSA